MWVVSQLSAIRAKHAQELAEVVREHNKKYSDMLAQRLNEEDALRESLEAAKKVTRARGVSVACCVRRATGVCCWLVARGAGRAGRA